MRDLLNNIDIRPVLVPVAAALADDTAQVGAIIDHQGYESITYLIVTGTLADAGATFTALLEESEDSGMAGATAVADADLIGTEALASFTQASDSKTFKLGYKGSMRYSRLTITPAGNAGNAPLAAVCVRGHPHRVATANPPA
jgi:hypothetical protein